LELEEKNNGTPFKIIKFLAIKEGNTL